MQRAHSTRGKIDRPHGGATSSIRESKVSVVLVPWCTQALHKLIITLLPLKPGEPASRRFDWGSRWHRPALLPEQEQPPPGAPSRKSSPCWSPLAIIIFAIAIKVSTMWHGPCPVVHHVPPCQSKAGMQRPCAPGSTDKAEGWKMPVLKICQRSAAFLQTQVWSLPSLVTDLLPN